MFAWCITMHCITDQSFKQIWPYFSRFRPKIHSCTFCWYGNIWNFKTRELQIRHKWNLAQICTTWTPLIHQHMRISMNVRVELQIKTTRKCHENNRLSHHLKAGEGHWPSMREWFLLELNCTFKSVPLL